jgi:hypothetical protein
VSVPLALAFSSITVMVPLPFVTLTLVTTATCPVVSLLDHMLMTLPGVSEFWNVLVPPVSPAG